MHSAPLAVSLLFNVLYIALICVVFWRAAKQKRRWLRVLLCAIGALLLAVTVWNTLAMTVLYRR